MLFINVFNEEDKEEEEEEEEEEDDDDNNNDDDDSNIQSHVIRHSSYFDVTNVVSLFISTDVCQNQMSSDSKIKASSDRARRRASTRPTCK